MSHPFLTNLPPPSPPTHTFLGHLEFSSPKLPSVGSQSGRRFIPGVLWGNTAGWALGLEPEDPKPSLDPVGSRCATLGKLTSLSFNFLI